MMLGDFEITALNDGVVEYRTSDVLPTASPQDVASFLKDNGMTDPVGMSYNAFLINTGSKLVLIDTGSGGKLNEDPSFRGTGRLLSNLRAAGYEPEQVDEVYITHRGQDHIGGLTVGNARTFPNALLRAPSAEFDMFLDTEKFNATMAKSNGNANVKAWLTFTRDLFTPYNLAERFQPIASDNAVLVPGIRPIATPGHTPGHTIYIIESKGERMIIMGDLVLSSLQFADPSLGSSFDADRSAAAGQRIRMLTKAADEGDWIAGGHISFPGIGHVARQQSGFRFIPANYAIP